MKTWFWFCLALLIPGMLLRIPVGGAGILATDIILPLFALIWLLKKIILKEPLPKNNSIISGLVFLAIMLISFIFGASELFLKEQLLSFAYIIRFASILIFGWAATDLFRTQKLYKKFFRYLFWITTLVLSLGFLQFYLIPDISTWSTEGGWDPHTGRLLGTWLDPNFLAGFLGLMIPVMIGQWYQDQNFKTRFPLGILIFISLWALFLTFSRSGYLATSIGMSLFFVFRDPKVLIIAVFFAGLGIISSERAQTRLENMSGTISALIFRNTDEIDPTASLRLQSWQQSLALWKKQPIIGIGYNTYRYQAAEEGIVDENYFSAGGSDSTHLTVLVTTGILGFLAFLYFFGTLIWSNFLQFWHKKNPVYLGFSTGILALFLHAIFVNSLLFPFLLIPLLAIHGVLQNKPQ